MRPTFSLARRCTIFGKAVFSNVENHSSFLFIYFYWSYFAFNENAVFFISMIVRIVITFMPEIFFAKTFTFNTLFSASMNFYLTIMNFFMSLFVFWNIQCAFLSCIFRLEILIIKLTQLISPHYVNYIIINRTNSFSFAQLLAFMLLVAFMIRNIHFLSINFNI